MKICTNILVPAILLAQPLQAQTTNDVAAVPELAATVQTPGPVADTAMPAIAASQILIPRDTPIHLMVVKEVTTKTHQAGHLFPLRVDKPVVIGGVTAVPVGAKAWGEVISAESSGIAGKSGKLSARLLYVEAGGTRIAIDGERAAQGKSGTGETVVAVIGLGLLGLFARGNNAKLKAGEMFTAFTTEDTPMKLAQ